MSMAIFNSYVSLPEGKPQDFESEKTTCFTFVRKFWATPNSHRVWYIIENP